MRSSWAGRPTGRATALGALMVLLGAVLVGGLLRVKVDTGVESFLPANDPTLTAVRRKASDFGGDPVIVLLHYPAAREFLTDHDQLYRLLRTEGQLATLPDVATVYGPATVLNQLAGAAQDFLTEVAGTRDGLRLAAQQTARQAGEPPPAVTAAGDAAVARFDLRYAPLIVRGLPVGLPTLSNPKFGVDVVFGSDGRVRPDWRFIVPAPDTVAVLVRPRQDLDQPATQRLVAAIHTTLDRAGLATTSATVSGVPVVTAALTTEVSREGPLLGLLVVLVVLARFLLAPMPSAVARVGSRRHRLLARLRPLAASALGGAATLALFGWLGHPLSFASVLLLPLLLGVGSSFPLYLATLTNRRRVLVMTLAGSAAFLALALSPLPFVRDLGYALSVGVLCTVASAFALGVRGGPPVEPEPTVVAAERPAPLPTSASRPVRIAVAVAVIAAALLGWLVLPRLSVQADPESLAGGLPALRDASSVEAVLGASGEVGVELTGPDVVGPAALRWERAAQLALAAGFGDRVRPVVSPPGLLGFLGPAPTPAQIHAALGLLPHYLSASVIRPDHRAAVLIYGLRLQDLGAQQRMLAGMRAALPAPPPGDRAELVGLPVAAARGYELLMRDRYPANLAGILAAGLVLAFGLRRRTDAVRAAAAAALATGWGLAALWVLGVGLSPLTVALGSLVTVTGCEFLVLLAEARRRGTGWLRRSVGYACLTSVLGYLVLAGSRLWLVREFGLVLAGAVVLSFLAALLVVWLWPPPGPERRPGAETSATGAAPAARVCT